MELLIRKAQESVVIGNLAGNERLFKVTVVQIGDGTVTLGFEVDPGISVHAAEMWEQFYRSGRLNHVRADAVASYVAKN